MLLLLLQLTQRSKALWIFNFVIALMLAPAWKAVAQSDLTPSSAAATVIPLYNFGFDTTKGSGLVSSLIADKEGALYGTTYSGGAGGGTVFKLTPPAKGETAWKHTVLYSFFGYDEGSHPAAGLIFDQQGVVLYGTTEEGGYGPNSAGYGTVFKLEPPAPGHKSWTKTDIYYFCSVGYYCNDGEYPVAELVIGPDLALYGTTSEGGANGYGTVFKLTPPASGTLWDETVLYSFGDGNDGGYPKAGLIVDKQGVLYGTTYEGGSSGYGTVFKLTPPATGETGWSHTVLHSFDGGSEGANPRATMVADARGGVHGAGGGLYGTTTYGGANCDNSYGCGTVFKMVPPDKYIPKWTLSTLHSFKYNDPDDGQYPLGALTFGRDGGLYGTTEYGGTPNRTATGPCGLLYNCGTIFRLTGADVSWTLTYLYRFCSDETGCPAGAYPTAGLTAYQGALYGTTSYDGEGAACFCGAIFKMDYPSETAERRPPD